MLALGYAVRDPQREAETVLSLLLAEYPSHSPSEGVRQAVWPLAAELDGDERGLR
jgi:hypothetical protein